MAQLPLSQTKVHHFGPLHADVGLKGRV